MIKLLLFVLLLSTSSVLYAYGEEDDDETFGAEESSSLKSVIDVSKYNPSPISIKKSIIKIIIKNNWVITKQTKDIILARYKNGAKVKVTIQPAGIIIEEVKNEARFKENWLRSLKNNFIKNVILEHHYDVAKSQLNIK